MSPIFRLYRHPWEATGSGDGKSIQKAMGKTSLALWDVLLRESLQNSWDARMSDHIRFSVIDYELSCDQSVYLLSNLFDEFPKKGSSKELPGQLNHGRLPVLIISDTGTSGLGGPIRANFAPAPGERSDFADFVRNFGRGEEKGLGGGTYGYGKGVLYQASKVGVCLVYSQAVVGDEIENRLIGVSGGDKGYDEDGLKFTGRNWWGIIADDGIVDPLIGPAARLVAEAAGIPVPAPDQTGTTIMILAPEDPEVATAVQEPASSRASLMWEAAMKWAWPHALDFGNGPGVHFLFRHGTTDLPELRPLQDPRIKHFAEAYKSSVDADMFGGSVSPYTKIIDISSERPKKKLGSLSIRQASATLSGDSALQNTVALMRSPRIVVKYLPVTAPPDEYSLYSVFMADEGVDEDFASSEPVTHDDWIIKEAVVRGNRNFVRSALKRIEETFNTLYGYVPEATASQKSAGSTRISSILGGVVGGINGYGVSSQPLGGYSDSKGGKRNSRRAQVRLVTPPALLLIEDAPHVGFTYEIFGGKSGERYSISAKAKVVTNTGGTENDSPLAASQPSFVGWMRGGELMAASAMSVTTPSTEQIVAVFTQPNDVAVTASIEMEKAD
ncbi:hypothetical protein ACFQ9D_12755 [Arthrobacter koreensis]|uniref:hypothetical protein n=1 Tax=Arthrobacter koreensis TaxID=199136 RepID=UPI00363BEF4C